MRKIVNVNLETLKELINKHSVEVSVFGHAPFKDKAIKAPALFEEIHTCADCTKDEFTEYVNAMSAEDWRTKDAYVRVPEIDILFKNVKFFGMFQEVGYEALEGQAHIFHRDIKKVISL